MWLAFFRQEEQLAVSMGYRVCASVDMVRRKARRKTCQALAKERTKLKRDVNEGREYLPRDSTDSFSSM